MAMKTDGLQNFLALKPPPAPLGMVCVRLRWGARPLYPAGPTASGIGNFPSREEGTALAEPRRMIFQLYMYIYISFFVILVIKRRARADISADGCRWRLRASSPPCLSLPFLEGGGVCICWVGFLPDCWLSSGSSWRDV